MRHRPLVRGPVGMSDLYEHDINLRGPEVKSGNLYILQNCPNKSSKVPVCLKIYGNCFDHYAVIYRDQTYCNASAYINLKNCEVCRGNEMDTEFHIVSKDSEGRRLTFIASNTDETNDWIDVLQGQNIKKSSSLPFIPNLSPVIPRSPLLPTLEETDEDE